MPTFPTYRGELPPCLNPRNPRHYWLLIYWVFFRPTALKSYLYQADRDLYREGPGLGIFRAWDVPAYRNLYLMVLPAVLLLSVLVGLPIVLIVSWIEGVPMNWLGWLGGMVFGMVIGIVLGVIGSIASSTLVRVARSITFSVVMSISGGAAISVIVAVLMVVGVFSIAVGIVVGMAVGIVANVVENIGSGLARGVVSGILLGIVGMIVFGIISVTVTELAISLVTGVTMAIAVGIVSGVIMGATRNNVATGVAIGAVVGLMAGLLVGGVTSIIIGMMDNMVIGIEGAGIVGIAVVASALRLPFYPFQLALAWWGNASRKIQHPLEWDELLVLPLPKTLALLLSRLEQDRVDGLGFVARTAQNPFQRWLAQRALQAYLHHEIAPLHFLYAILSSPTLNEYIVAPLNNSDWERLQTTKLLLLGELARRRQWINYDSNPISSLSERFVSSLTFALRDHRQTPLTGLAGMLYDLLDADTIAAEDFDLSSYRDIYTDLTSYTGGEEIVGSFEALAAFLSYKTLSTLPSAAPLASPLSPNEQSIRPTVLTALHRLGEVGAEIAAYRDATSRVSQQGALLRATDGLDGLDEYVVGEVMAPEQTILRRVIRQWRRLVSEEGGEVGRVQEDGPVANPYVSGNPVTGTLFVGREDILRRLEELWAPAGVCPSVVIYGHRRMGKTSILHNLGARFGAQATIVNFNMQLMGYLAHTNELLLNLALALYDSLLPTQQAELGEPEEERFFNHNPYTAFRRFLTQLERVRSVQRFFITVDEFELIEEAIREGRLEARLLDFWRGIIQTYPWFVMVFAGLHTLQEMTKDYWNPLFGSVTTISVSFLRPPAARRLITQPTPDFPLDYNADAIEHIIRLTNGQPYLIQLICHGLVTRFNRQTFEEGLKQPRRFTIRDVQAIINAPEFYRDGIHYFIGVWSQGQHHSPTQTTVLSVLAPSVSGLPLEIIAQKSALSLHESQSALQTLAQHDCVIQENGHWRFTVELMRRWVVMRRK